MHYLCKAELLVLTKNQIAMKKLLLILASAYIINTNAQIITTVAGNGTGAYAGDGGAATASEINYPTGVALDVIGNLYIADYGNNRIRMVNTIGTISTFVGNGSAGYSGDGGQATVAELNHPNGMAIDASGNLYIADCFNNCIRKVTTSGIISTTVGNGASGYSGNGGQATAAGLNHPSQVVLDAAGTLYFADQNNNVIRKVNAAGIISTVVGNGTGAFSGDGGQAAACEINYSNGVTLDAAGNIYVADQNNSRVRKVNSSGIINTIVGTGVAGFSGDGGQATVAELFHPTCISFGCQGNLYISDYGNNRIRKVTSSGVISTVAGNGTGAYSGDGGQGTLAEINTPIGIAVDAIGNMYIADASNNRVRKLTGVCQATDIYQISGHNTQISVYPNPANNKITIDANDVVELKLFDVLGKQIFATKTPEVDVSDFNDGVYFIQVQTKQSTTTQKIIVQH